MDELTLDDIVSHVVDVVPVEFLGRPAYIRKLTFDGQCAVGERFKDRPEEDDATPDDTRFLLACVLCNSKGELIFHDPTVGMELLRKVDGDEITRVLAAHRSANGDAPSEEVKNSNAVRAIS